MDVQVLQNRLIQEKRKEKLDGKQMRRYYGNNL